MENSIEKIKKQLELILKVRKEQKEIIECAGGACINCDPDIKDLSESIEILSNYERLKIENMRLREIRNDIKYGTESIHLIPENDLVQINFNKYMIEIEKGKFVDLKVVYQENKENKELIERMRAFLLKEKLMQKFLESEE